MQRRKFNREFKLEAVRLVKERGVSIAQASRDLDVHENVLRKWVKEFSSDPQQAFPEHLAGGMAMRRTPATPNTSLRFNRGAATGTWLGEDGIVAQSSVIRLRVPCRSTPLFDFSVRIKTCHALKYSSGEAYPTKSLMGSPARHSDPQRPSSPAVRSWAGIAKRTALVKHASSIAQISLHSVHFSKAAFDSRLTIALR